MFQNAKTDVLSVQTAGAVLGDIETRRAQLSGLLGEVGLKLKRAEDSLGDDWLNGDEGAARTVADLRVTVDGLTAGLGALERRRGVALIDQRRATAVDLRHQAAAKRADLAALESKTSKVLAELSRLESVEYDGCILGAQRIGSWISRTTSEAQYWQTTVEVGSDPLNSRPYAIPRSRRLRDEADALELQARDIEVELARSEQMPTTSPVPPDLTPATHQGACFCGACSRARQDVSPNEWAASVEAGANAGA